MSSDSLNAILASKEELKSRTIVLRPATLPIILTNKTLTNIYIEDMLIAYALGARGGGGGGYLDRSLLGKIVPLVSQNPTPL